ncbi:NAD-dependent deacylase [Weeksellaceae bacterium KMM 9724]|uniref:SIR2 family NAD-dependent protein deacylase n=1 Tax=Profundicola chukchiensis TaxID=2961959 RepID=UPI002439A271|nr:NAD-dependent deacylase [Profundicola chukchiensis]MDG4949619.1 NAD-dependent deacylase [Profundicola chukchiensis]
MSKKHIVVLTGAGISQESGIKTFRDSNGLWENHDIMEVASPEGFRSNPELVLNFYNLRRRQLQEVEPNAAHLFLAELEKHYDVSVVTQNVDDLHERAGSSNIIHLHGELKKARSVADEYTTYDHPGDLNLGDLAPDGHQLRPHIVWFGEAVPEMSRAMEVTRKADILLIIGTSMQVYPAAGLIDFVDSDVPIYIVDPEKVPQSGNSRVTHIQEKAVKGCEKLREILLKE